MTDWNQYRGDRRNAAHRPDLQGPDRLEETWSVDLAAPASCSPVCRRDTVYVGTERALYAFDTRGARRWGVETDAPVAGTPVVTSDRVFVATADGTVFALEPTTGDVEWQYAGTEPLESSLAMADGLLFVGDAAGLAALEADTGERLWVHETDAPVVGCPAIADRRDVSPDWGWDHDRVYVPTRAESVLALETEEGTDVWSVPTDGTVVGGPTIDGDRVYTADDAGTVLALDADTGQSWFAYEADTTFTTGPTVLTDADAVFAGGADGDLHVVGTTFGKRKLRGLLFSKNGVSLDGTVTAGPVVVGELLCVGDSSGTLYGIGVDDDRFAEFVWHHPTDRTPTYTPAVAPTQLYVVFDDDRLSCLTWSADE